MYALLPLLFVLMYFGLGAIEKNQSQITKLNVQPNQALATGQAFIMYRNAVVAYEEANLGQPITAGSVSTGNIASELPAGVNAADFPPTAGNYVVPGAGTIETIYVYAVPIAGEIAAVTSDGDESYGVVSGSTWSNPIYGQIGTVPSQVPSGDIVSVVQVGE